MDAYAPRSSNCSVSLSASLAMSTPLPWVGRESGASIDALRARHTVHDEGQAGGIRRGPPKIDQPADPVAPEVIKTLKMAV